MQTGRRNIQSGSEFEKYYTKPAMTEKTEIAMGSVNDTCLKIQSLIPRWAHQTERISKVLQLNANDRKTTAYTLWYYFFTYFQYKEDRQGVEQLRSPRRAFWDRKQGIDCDCMAISIFSMLNNCGLTDAHCKIIQRTNDTDYSHIYIVLPKEAGKVDWNNPNTYWVIDPVCHEFNKEVLDIKNYKTYPMKSSSTVNGLGNIDINTLDGMGAGGNSVASLPVNYPYQAATILSHLLSYKNNPSLFKSEIQAAIAIENNWRKVGLIHPSDKFFYNISKSGLNGFWSNVLHPVKTAKQIADEAADIAREKAQQAAHIAAGATFLLAREALKLCLRFNVFGISTLIAYVKKVDVNRYNNVLDTWYKFGGDKATMATFINEGKNKVPRQVAPSLLNKIPQIKGLIERANYIHYNNVGIGSLGVAVVDDAAEVGVATTAAATATPLILEILAAITPIIAMVKEFIPNKNNTNTNTNTDPTGGNGGGGNGGNGGGGATGSNTAVKVGIAAAAGLALKLIFF